MAGFNSFFRQRSKEAMEHFHKAKLDVRELLCFFEDLQPSGWDYAPKHGNATDLRAHCMF
jgi:hypothetical protein